MATTNISYQGIGTSITMTMTSKAAAAWFSSALVDNQTNLYMDALVGGTIQVGAVASDGTIEIYIAASWDGVEFSGGADAGNGTITWGTTGSTSVEGYKNLFGPFVIAVDTTDDNNDIPFGPISVAELVGAMPLEWAVVMKNATDATTNATGTNNHIEYTGIEYTTA